MEGNRGRAWFVPKAYGYGASPWSWQRWALVAGFVAAVVLLALVLIVRASDGEPGAGRLLLFFALTAVLALVLAMIAKATTDGEWRWRWGEKDGPGT